MKIFRRAQEGVNPDLEISRHLTQVGFDHSAPLLGALEYQKGRSEPRTLGVLNQYVPNEGDAWHYTLDALGLFYESALGHAARRRRSTSPGGATVPAWCTGRRPISTADAIGPYLDSAEMLGRRTADLHKALADDANEDFRPEPFTTLYQRSLYQSMRAQVRPTLAPRAPAARPVRGPPSVTTPLEVASSEARLLEVFGALRRHRIDVAASGCTATTTSARCCTRGVTS